MMLFRAVLIAGIAGACITFDPIQQSTTCADCISAECTSNDDCGERICLGGRCTSMSTDGPPRSLTLTSVRGTSSNSDPNGQPRVRDRLRLEGESLSEATVFQLIDKNGNVAALTSTLVGNAVEVVIPSAFAQSLREALGPTVDLRIEHPTLGSIVKRLEIRRGEQGPVGATGDEGDMGGPGPSFPGQPVACGALGFGVLRQTTDVDLQCMPGRTNVVFSAIGGTPPVLDTERASAPATVVAVASGAPSALRVNHDLASGTSLRVIGSSRFDDSPPFTQASVKLPVYLRYGSVSGNAGKNGRELDGNTAPGSMCDEGDILLAGSCSSTGRLFADCPTIDRLGSTCLTAATTTQALGLRCRADDDQPPVGTTIETQAWLVCLRHQ